MGASLHRECPFTLPVPVAPTGCPGLLAPGARGAPGQVRPEGTALTGVEGHPREKHGAATTSPDLLRRRFLHPPESQHRVAYALTSVQCPRLRQGRYFPICLLAFLARATDLKVIVLGQPR